jgi:hypothetical protein
LAAIVAVRRTEFQRLVRAVPFLALPREEIDRLYAALEVLAVNEETLRHDAELVALHSCIAIHHNYSWLTFRRDTRRTLLLSAALVAEGPPPLFLDQQFVASARRQVEERVPFTRGCDVRIAGILQDTADTLSVPRVGLLSIARLPDRTAAHAVERYGNVELHHARSEFDASSQVVIDHLAAL